MKKFIVNILVIFFFFNSVNIERIGAQNSNLPVIKSNVSSISIRDGLNLKKNFWRLAPEAKPDVYKADLINGKTHKVTFYTDVDSISFNVELGKKYDFIIKWGDKLCYQQIKGEKYVPKTNLDKRSQSGTEIDAAFLKKNLVKINSIDDAKNNDDLSFLKDELDGVEILMLGEQTHGDGGTFLAKTRIIKHLHETQNFNVLVFESGLADMYRVWKMIQEGEADIDVFNYGVFPIWANSEQTVDLFKYILEQSKTANPLIVAGFDMQPTGNNMRAGKRYTEINNYLTSLIDFKEENYPLFTKAFKSLGFIRSKEFNEDKYKALEKEFLDIINSISKNDSSIDGKFMMRYINNYFKTITLYSKADLRQPSNTPHVFNIRDKVMAENFKFLKEEIYPDKKLIVWGANSHLGYGRGFLQGFNERAIQGKGMIPMGQYLKIDYQDKLYTMAFTSYEGSIGSLRGQIRNLPPSHKLTLESMIQTQGYKVGFLSMNFESLKSLRFVSRIYGHAEMSGIWSKMCDGIFFIKTMTPNILTTKK